MPECDRVRLRSLHFRTMAIAFRARFTHASADRSETSSVWITATSMDGMTGCGESCPRPYVTGETLASAEAFFRRHEAALLREIDSFLALRRWVRDHEADIDLNPAAWCAIELAILDILGKTAGEPIEKLLWLSPLAGRYQYTAVLGDSDHEAFERTADRYQRLGFRDFKVKLSGRADHDRQKLAWFCRPAAAGMRVRLDANNAWPDAETAIAFLESLACPVFAVEEPVGAGRFADFARIARATQVPIVLDESIARRSQLATLTPPETWIINLRVSKMGGLLRSLDLVDASRAAGLRIIVGAQVGETSLLTRAGLTMAQAAGSALAAQEGAFGTWLLERDVCDPPLMFSEGGRLDVAAHPRLASPGLGVVG